MDRGFSTSTPSHLQHLCFSPLQSSCSVQALEQMQSPPLRGPTWRRWPIHPPPVVAPCVSAQGSVCCPGSPAHSGSKHSLGSRWGFSLLSFMLSDPWTPNISSFPAACRQVYQYQQSCDGCKPYLEVAETEQSLSFRCESEGRDGFRHRQAEQILSPQNGTVKSTKGIKWPPLET